MKRINFKKAIAGVLGVGLAFCATGCSALEGLGLGQTAVSVTSIQKTASEGLVDTYTIYYSDGTTSTFTVTNGKDGTDGKDGVDGKDGKDGKDGIDTDDPPVSITSVRKTASEGLVDTYTIYYSNGTTSAFTVTNGKDGVDGQDGLNGANGVNGADGAGVTAWDLYETYKAVYGEEISYAEFLSAYLSFDDTAEDGRTVIGDCLRSVGKVYCQFTELNADTVAPNDTKPAMYTGSCVIYRIDEDYTYFITNYHVIYDKDGVNGKLAEKTYCYLYGSEGAPQKTTDASGETTVSYGDYAIECSIVGGSAQYDIAIVRAETSAVKAVNESVKPISFAEEYFVGETAIAVGNPNGEGISVTEGIVCVDNEYVSLKVDETQRSYRSMRIDTALYGGNSGGGVFNARGELIGIANAGKIADQNINFAIPVQIVRAATENIMYYHEDGDESTNGVYKITLGVTVAAKNSKYVYDEAVGYGRLEEDITVLEVLGGSIAARIGLQKDDVLTSLVIDGVRYELDRYFRIADYLLALKEGSVFHFEYLRDGETQATSAYCITKTDLAQIA